MAKRKNSLNNDSILYRNPDVQFSKIDQEIVLLSPDGSNYIKLNEVGSRIWELLENRMIYSDLIFKLTEEFEVIEKECEADVLPFLQIAIQKKIISLGEK